MFQISVSLLFTMISIVWILALTIFGFLVLLSVIFVVFSWFKINRFFYVGRFGVKYPNAEQMGFIDKPSMADDNTFAKYDQSLSAMNNETEDIPKQEDSVRNHSAG